MRFYSRALLGLFLTALTVGLLAIAGNTVRTALETRWADEGQTRPARERVFTAQVAPLEFGVEQPVLTAFGEVRSARTLELRAPAEGTVVELAEGFADGAAVMAGDMLLRIDPADAQSALDTASADLREAETELLDARRALILSQDELAAIEAEARLLDSALARQQDLLDRGVGSAATVETAEIRVAEAQQAIIARRQGVAQAETRVSQSEITLERRRISVAEAERTLSETELTAAFSGVLSEVNIAAGRLVSRNEQIARLIDPEALEVAFRVSTAQYARLIDDDGRLPELPVSVVLDVFGLDLTASATLVREAGSVEEGQSGRLLFARVDVPRGLRVGDFVRVDLVEPELRGVARLPATAYGSDGNVLVVGENDRLEAVEVTLMRRQGDDVLIRGRELQGRDVVLARTPVLDAGIRINPVRPSDGSEPAAEPEAIALDPERRARLIAFVEGNSFIPADVKERLLTQLNQETVPARVVARLESRMGS